jgi:hypothetical protein
MVTEDDASPLLRRSARLAKNAGSSAYGVIAVSAVIAGTSHNEPRAGIILEAAVSTLAALWLAHIYSAVLAARFEDPGTSVPKTVRRVALHELPMLEVAIPPCALLASASFAWMNEPLAVRLALWSGVVELLGFGIFLGRQLGRSPLASLGTGLFYAATGGGIIALKAALH